LSKLKREEMTLAKFSNIARQIQGGLGRKKMREISENGALDEDNRLYVGPQV
jgi:hypothetical protein